jgi:GTPase
VASEIMVRCGEGRRVAALDHDIAPNVLTRDPPAATHTHPAPQGFDGERPLYVDVKASRQRAWQACHAGASRTVTFVDLCGHAAYLKSTLYGLASTAPDYSLVVVGLNMGLSTMTKEHLGISIALGIPLVVVATKVDLAPPEVAKHTLEVINKTLKQVGRGRWR